MSGWFVDPAASERIILGDCRCPGKPHDEDYIDVRRELSGVEAVDFLTTSTSARLRTIVVDWNLRDESGPIPIDDDHIAGLQLGPINQLAEQLGKLAEDLNRPLPNASGAPSRNGSRGSASRTQTTRRRR